MTTPIDVAVGLATWTLRVRPEANVALRRRPVPPTGDARELVRAALEQPFGLDFPMRRAVTPDDRVALVLDEGLPHVAELMSEVVAHLGSAGIPPSEVTVVLPPGHTGAAWIDALPDEFADVRVETHDPEDRQKLAYLATTKAGRRVYLNKTLVDAEFVAVLTGRRFDPTFGYGGAAAALFQTLSDGETLASLVGQFTTDPPDDTPTAALAEATEVAHKIGAPFVVQVIEGAGDEVQEVVAGLLDSAAEGARRQDARWRATVEDRPELVVAAVGGSPERVDFLALASAAACAARVVQPGGRVVVLSDAAPALGEGAELLRQADDADRVGKALAKRKPDDWPAAALWAFAAQRASLFVASGWPDDVTEELFATPVASAAEVQRLIDAAERVLVVPDAHKTIIDLG